jgi:hypothetical protein
MDPRQQLVTPQQRDEWLANPVTQELIRDLQRTRQDALEAWAKQAYIGKTEYETLQLNMQAIGAVDMIQQLLETLEQYKITSEKEE